MSLALGGEQHATAVVILNEDGLIQEAVGILVVAESLLNNRFVEDFLNEANVSLGDRFPDDTLNLAHFEPPTLNSDDS